MCPSCRWRSRPERSGWHRCLAGRACRVMTVSPGDGGDVGGGDGLGIVVGIAGRVIQAQPQHAACRQDIFDPDGQIGGGRRGRRPVRPTRPAKRRSRTWTSSLWARFCRNRFPTIAFAPGKGHIPPAIDCGPAMRSWRMRPASCCFQAPHVRALSLMSDAPHLSRPRSLFLRHAPASSPPWPSRSSRSPSAGRSMTWSARRWRWAWWGCASSCPCSCSPCRPATSPTASTSAGSIAWRRACRRCAAPCSWRSACSAPTPPGCFMWCWCCSARRAALPARPAPRCCPSWCRRNGLPKSMAFSSSFFTAATISGPGAGRLSLCPGSGAVSIPSASRVSSAPR